MMLAKLPLKTGGTMLFRHDDSHDILIETESTIGTRALLGVGLVFLLAVVICVGSTVWLDWRAGKRHREDLLELQRISNINLPKTDTDNGNLPFPRPDK